MLPLLAFLTLPTAHVTPTRVGVQTESSEMLHRAKCLRTRRWLGAQGTSSSSVCEQLGFAALEPDLLSQEQQVGCIWLCTSLERQPVGIRFPITLCMHTHKQGTCTCAAHKSHSSQAFWHSVPEDFSGEGKLATGITAMILALNHNEFWLCECAACRSLACLK